MVNITALIVDDHPVYRKGLEVSLKSIQQISKILHASNGIEALELLIREKVNLVFMDIKMPEMNGIETTEKIRQMGSNVKILALSMFDDNSNVVKMFQQGVNGYLTKNCSSQEIEKSIEEVFAGHLYLSNEISKRISPTELKLYHQPKRESLIYVEPLSTRELDILKLICQEFSNNEIASILKVSVKTIESYKTRLYEKIGCKNMVGLVKYAYENNFIIFNG